MDEALADLGRRAGAELRGDILPFWETNVIGVDGWLPSEIADDLTVRTDGDRHSVIASRILWTFAAAARSEPDPGLRERWLAAAGRAHAILTEVFWDDECGGVYWSVGPDREAASDRKQVYAQAFALYGLAEWSAASADPEPFDRALALFEAIESRSRGADGGYAEALSRAWGSLDDVRLSARDLNAPLSMNTHLHVLEAYSTLARVTDDARVRSSLSDLLTLCLDRVVAIDPWPHCSLFFDEAWHSLTPTISWGHDIEASWLLWDAAEVVEDDALSARTRNVVLGLADAVLERGVDADGGVLYEGTPTEILEPQKEWWPQAEAVVGFLNAHALSGEARFRDAALASWGFIERHVVDRERGEWFAVCRRDGEPWLDHPGSRKMGPWKCPYHNARACLEAERRTGVAGGAR